MKKLLSFLILTLVLSACWKSNNTNSNTIEKKISENTPLINIEEKTKKTKELLKKIWLTWEKLKKELANQKAWWKIIANLKGDERKKYILETEILPKIVKSWEVSEKCTATNLDSYTACLYVTKTPIEKLLEQLPKQLQDIVKKSYYRKMYSINKKNLLKKTIDPIAIQVKKEKIQEMYYNYILRYKSSCNRFPEEEVVDFCENLFKN